MNCFKLILVENTCFLPCFYIEVGQSVGTLFNISYDIYFYIIYLLPDVWKYFNLFFEINLASRNMGFLLEFDFTIMVSI